MPITAEQRANRRKGIGSSDAAAILGLDPFKTAGDVYTEKVYATDDIPATPAMKLGNVFEAALIDYAVEELQIQVERNVTRVSDDGINACNLDALVVGRPEGIEAKRVGWHSPNLRAYDEAAGTVPDSVCIQCHQQMYVAGLKLVWVPVLLVDEVVIFKVERNDALIDVVRDATQAFWNDHVLRKEPPSGDKYGAVALDTLKRVKREPNKVVVVTEQAAAEYLAACEVADDAKNAKELAQARLLEEMGDAEEAHFGGGSFTYFEQTRKEYTVKATAFRVLRKKLNKPIEA